MARFLGRVQMGCLERDQTPIPRSKKPWLIDLSLLKPDFPTVAGDIADFDQAPTFANWSLGNTPHDSECMLQWNQIEDQGRQLLICDRVILVRVSWDDLNEAGYVSGRTVEIDGQKFICRLLTGGSDFKVANDGYKGGSPTNEWDRIIGGDETVLDLPKPAKLGSSKKLSSQDLESAHNQIWNWLGAVSWTQEPYQHRATARCCRGYHSARFFYLNTQSHRHEDIGWRPVLEPL